MPTSFPSNSSHCELLSPAGSPDAAYAAFQYGADAVYLGLKRFSARADATNFTNSELSRICAYAHSLTPKRRVYVALNTLALCCELQDLLETLYTIKESAADAVIIQDLGVLYIAKQNFAELPLHASTQVGIHNLEGAIAAQELGFKRVILARELLLEEISDISQHSTIETEVFIHGALCYSYSGACLFSSHATGNSANRGRCVQPCRELYRTCDAGREDFSLRFSMKDLHAGELVLKLRDAGVKGFKIEGRKRSPLYVATPLNLNPGRLKNSLDR